MTISVTINFISYEEAITALARLRTDAPTAKATVVTTDAPDAAKPETTKAPAAGNAKPSAAEKKAAASTQPSAASSGSGDASAPSETKNSGTAVDYDAVSKAIAGAVANGKRPQAVEVLTSFGAKSGKDLKPEQYESFMTKLTAATTEEALT